MAASAQLSISRRHEFHLGGPARPSAGDPDGMTR
jgi:hypothetical protein